MSKIKSKEAVYRACSLTVVCEWSLQCFGTFFLYNCEKSIAGCRSLTIPHLGDSLPDKLSVYFSLKNELQMIPWNIPRGVTRDAPATNQILLPYSLLPCFVKPNTDNRKHEKKELTSEQKCANAALSLKLLPIQQLGDNLTYQWEMQLQKSILNEPAWKFWDGF